MAAQSDIRNRVLQRYRLGLKTKAPIGSGAFKQQNIMLVGEQTSHPEVNKYHLPFCSLKACSGWLNGLLEDAGIPEDQLFWVNALDNDGSEVDLASLHGLLMPRLVVALGNVARDQLTKRRIQHEHVPHPQYWKRFRNKQVYPLIPLLTGLIHVS